MKKAVIQTGGKQYLVHEGEVIDVDLLNIADHAKSVDLDVLLVIDGDDIGVGMPILNDHVVTNEIIEEDIRAEKVTAIRYKAKKRVHKTRGHRQHHSRVKILKISKR